MSALSHQHDEQLFNPLEVEEFRQDDASAGRTLGTLLTVLFTYTAIIMSGVVLWTIHILS